ncbi:MULTISPECIES: PAS domain-containing protein [Chryseobacterium]|uniref:histidine kinase n=1 Tax=Chryseobacterium camelliae TaxID=1265445 RepID=A0ABU0TFR4_9FLAO|nr:MULTISPECIES: PAS domain-containing protein [Chryseobacterium]MDT3406299.1 PAS domain S-box-containing protein [Pseudacidovorax intermedius]MDQ1095902.1 PAS domain S-box-containing protein [Chryseobacterium camelliae]MDQ1099839.1 PAS domain S-box-containing protein [Chryseobacterium sp. SORGH_AS_1048]MDR6087185.1 PAS domain S-box-containing protein [Chryseobacterium sp. SORGH_AS_0909]MDR6131558.1 PAS domain S-box-containing protein [Chryseobacterium sp. SORGH_AS_1175]
MVNFSSSPDHNTLLEILKQSDDATAIYTGQDLIIQFANDAMLRIWRKDSSVYGKKFGDALPEMEGQPFISILQDVWKTGKTYQARDTPADLEINGISTTSYFDFIFKPIKDQQGSVYAILHTAADVTERVHAWRLIREKEIRKQKLNEDLIAGNEELNNANTQLNTIHKQLVSAEHRIMQLINTSPIGLALLQGKDMIIEAANEEMLKIWGYRENMIIGKALLDVFPVLKGQAFFDQLSLVYSSGEIVSLEEMVFGFKDKKYLNINFHPLLKPDGMVDAVMATVQDVTEKVIAKKILEKNEIRLQESNEELGTLNEELKTANEELGVLNDQYSEVNKKLEEANRTTILLNEELEQKNIDLRFSNRGFKEINLQLTTSNQKLNVRNTELKASNDTITYLNKKLTDSEASFKNLIAQAPVATMLLKGEQFIVTMINKSMLDLIGKDANLIGKPLFEELPELRGQKAADMLMETYTRGIPHSDFINPIAINRNGNLETGFFNFTYTPYIENGKVTGVIDMAVEVTHQVLAIQERDQIIAEKSQLEETLRKSQQRLEGILETMAEGVGVIDAAGRMVYANPMAQQILGLSESCIKERTYDDPRWQNLRLDGSPLPSEEHPMSIMMRTQRPVYDHEIAVQPPDRDRMYISINAAPIFDTEGNLTGGIGTFMDVTTRRMITQGKEDFISIASHELKTPVTALKASLQLLQRSHHKLPEESRTKLVEQSIRSLDKLSHLITDLLDTSRIEQGHMKLNRQPFSLSELFDDCCKTLAQNTGQKIHFEGDTQLTVEADHQQIGQVMVNFITNALKYAPESEQILIRAQKLNDHEVKVSVSDQGPGIPQEKLTHLFERYYRTEYKGQKFTGLGLGLYISAQIIKHHGGHIGVESEVGKGSEFWFTLPLQELQ